jgi:hypothetical protein
MAPSTNIPLGSKPFVAGLPHGFTIPDHFAPRLAHYGYTQISQRASKALKDTVFHANIQIQSIENGSVGSSDAPKEELPSEHHTIDRQDAERAALMQSWWDEAIVRNMDLPDGYTDVAVLLIKWDDELDELKTGEEVTRTTPYICPAETDTGTGERARGYLQEPIPLRNADR